MRESLTEKGGQQLLRAGGIKKRIFGGVGNVSAKFCRCHVFCVSGRFRFQCRQGNGNNDNENSEDNVERQFINLTCDFRFFPLCLSLLLT